MKTLIRGAPGAAVLAALAVAPVRAAEPTNIDEAVAHATPDITDAVRELCKDDAVVGMLNFRVQVGSEAPSYKVGPINSALAERMEIALLRGQKETDKKKVRIIRNASAVAAAAKKGIDYTKPEGRKALFDLKYPLLTKGDAVAPDLFLTGTAALDFDKKVVTIKFYTFKADSKDLQPLKLDDTELVVTAPIERSLLDEAGQSYVFGKEEQATIRRGAFDDRVPENVATAESQKKYKDGPTEELVRLTMFVVRGDKEVPVKIDKDDKGVSSWKTDKPLEPGDKVYFRLEPVKKDQRVAVVLKVNGKSTLFEDLLPAARCAKWVLEKGAEPLVVTGFYIKEEGENVKPFEVVPDETLRKEVLDDPAVGTVSMHVFIDSGRKNPPPPKNVPISRGVSQRKWEENGAKLETAKDVKDMILREYGAAKQGRGMISASNQVEQGNKLTDTEFSKDPQEVQQLTIRYAGK